jgi:hypothetical protein
MMGGHISDMTKKVKMNRESLLSKRKRKFGKYVPLTPFNPLKSIEPSPEKLKEVLKKIRLRKEREKKQQLRFLLFSFVIVIIFMISEYFYFF